jgi:hypothetical protein
MAAPGLRFLVPGWAQFAWGQSDRAMAHAGSFLAAVSTAAFCWGSWLGWGALGLAVLWHIASMMDVLRQWAFPVFPARVASAATVLALGLSVHLPVAGLLWLLACPTRPDAASGAGYLVNRLAYRQESPLPGHWVWVRAAPSRTPTTGRVLAVAGQEVECTGRRWRVDGREVQLPFPGPVTDYPDAWRFRVPADHVLVSPDSPRAGGEIPSPLMIVARDQILGRAWARVHPLWDRTLL